MQGTRMFRWWTAFALAVVLALALVPVALAQQAVKEIKVELGDFYFKPKEITVNAGERVRVAVTNVGAIPHEFEVSRLGAKDVKWSTAATVPDDEKKALDEHAARGTPEIWLPAKASGTVEFTPVNAGTFNVKCEIEGHTEAGMAGTLTVVAATGGSATAAQLPRTGGVPPAFLALGVAGLGLVLSVGGLVLRRRAR